MKNICERLFLSFGIFEDKVSSDVLGPWQTSIMKRFVNTVCSFYLVKVYLNRSTYICVKVFKNEPSKIYGREPLKKFFKAFFHKFYLLHSWIPWPILFTNKQFKHLVYLKKTFSLTSHTRKFGQLVVCWAFYVALGAIGTHSFNVAQSPNLLMRPLTVNYDNRKDIRAWKKCFIRVAGLI